MTTDSGEEADDERSDDSPSRGSYIRQREPHYYPPENFAGDFGMTGDEQRRGYSLDDEGHGSGCLLYRCAPCVGTRDQSSERGRSSVGVESLVRRRRPKPQRKDKDWKFVWPRDQNPRHGHWGYWERVKDLATGKGPDIWIEELHGNGPHHPLWTGWKTPGYQHPADPRVRWTNLGFEFRQDREWVSPIKSARREDGKKYDHQNRRYRKPHPGMWSDVVWGDTRGHRPLYFRDGIGREWVDPQVIGGKAFNLTNGPNPFFGQLP